MSNFDIPILLIIFNRLDTTIQVVDSIRTIQPSKLYIASDGPRKNREGEDEIVKAVRDYVLKSVDWNCEVKTLFHNENLGCGQGPAQAITWFFENEEMGIILEDDCIPSKSFFPYCEELLAKYKDDNRIYHIAGQNPLTLTKSPYSYYFARIQHCWGWASWKRAWNNFSFELNDLDDFIDNNIINKIFPHKNAQKFWLDLFKNIPNVKIDFWDYQWTYAIFKNNGLCINPTKNLVSNIGFNQNATHTLDSNSALSNQKRFEIYKIKHPPNIKVNNRILKEVNKISFGIQPKTLYSVIKEITPTPLKNVIKKSLVVKDY